MAKGSFLFVILDLAEEEPSGRSCPRGPSVHSNSGGAWAAPTVGLSLWPCAAGGTLGLEANVALLGGEEGDGEPWRGVWSCCTVSANPVLGTSSTAQAVMVQEELGLGTNCSGIIWTPQLLLCMSLSSHPWLQNPPGRPWVTAGALRQWLCGAEHVSGT